MSEHEPEIHKGLLNHLNAFFFMDAWTLKAERKWRKCKFPVYHYQVKAGILTRYTIQGYPTPRICTQGRTVPQSGSGTAPFARTSLNLGSITAERFPSCWEKAKGEGNAGSIRFVYPYPERPI